ncbi:MAG: response regulator transcription factor [Bacillales bacterium]
MKNKTILIVDNHKTFSNQIIKFLKHEGFNVYFASSAREAIDFCIKKVIDLIILELSLKDRDGVVVIEAVREFNMKLPIIVLSSRTHIESKILALNSGANDYLTKPANNYELLARINVQLRCFTSDENNIFKNGHVTIDLDGKTIYVNEKEVHFTNIEYKLITLLSNNLNKTLTYAYIISNIWGEAGIDKNGLRVFMAGVRKKLSHPDKNVEIIRTDIGTGYRMIKI